MSITPKKISILNALKTTLEGIDGTGNYNTTVKHVSRRYEPLMEIPPQKFPYISIFPQEASYIGLSNTMLTTGTDMDDIFNGFMVNTFGYVQVNADTGNDYLLQDALIELEADIIMAVMNNDTLTSTVDYIVPTGSAYIFASRQADVVGVVMVTFSIKYDFDPKTNP